MGVKVLVVDDDYIAGGLSRDLLIESGFEAELITDSSLAIQKIRENRYPLVVMDILMPGSDGLTLCHAIKNDPEIKSTKVVMVSGKTFQAEKDRAVKYGAELFIEKPYNVDLFVQQIQEVLNRGTGPKPAADVPAAEMLSTRNGPMSLTVWGCRSDGAAPSGSTRYGRKTSCVSVEVGGQIMIFDAGTGLTDLGTKLEAEGRGEAWLFLTHFHPDHVQGLPTFAPAANKAFHLHISGAHEPDQTLEALVGSAFQSAPATIRAVEASIDLYDLVENSYDILPGVKLTSFYANHPGATLGFIIETKGRKLVYCPDSEIYGETATSMQDYDEKLGNLCRGADLMIHDGRYSAEDYRTMKNHGHSAFDGAVDLAAKFQVKRLLLFHHDAQYSDAVLDGMGARAAQIVAEKGYSLQVAFAREGLSLGV